jgi:hypothetical protein
MKDRTVELLLEACVESGALQVYVLWVELDALATGKAFTTAEACTHALVPENARLRAAIEAVCGEVSARKLGKTLARWEGRDIASLRADCIGDDAAGILWRVSSTKPIPAATCAASDATMAAPQP